MQRLSILSVLLSAALLALGESIDLSGVWKFNTGESPVYNETVRLPGSMLTNGKGIPVSTETQWVGSLYDSSYFYNPYMERYRQEGNMKFPFFLTPERHYVGDAWYSRTVKVPKRWQGGVVELVLERPHITTTVYVNGHEAGRDSSLSVAHVFDLTPYIIPGKANKIEMRVSNSIDNVCVGQDSHSVTDQTQGNWNGVVGRIELRHRPEARIQRMDVYPMVDQKAVRVRLETAGKGVSRVNFSYSDPDGVRHSLPSAAIEGDSATVVLNLVDSVRLWSEHTPDLYTLTAEIEGGESRSVRFGMREISIKGRQFYLNGKPIYLRGTVGNCCFPETGYPPTDEESWVRIFTKCKEYGLNHMRFHSYCPPEAAFAAADRVGFYLQPEGPSWPNHGVKLGNGMTIDRYLMEETQRMVEAYGNHPSFTMLAAGNEPAGNWVRWVTDFCDAWRATGDNRRVYCGASVGGGWAFDPASDYHVKGGARGLDWDRHAPQSNDTYRGQITSFTQRGSRPVTFAIVHPLVSHEQGQWCAFPDLTETDQYTGVYKARNFEIFGDLLADNGMASQARKFLMASGRLQTLAYKYEIERNLRTPEYAGFQLLGLNDYSGQGTALVGVLNVHWREKGYCTSDDWTEFCSPVVPLARFDKFVYGRGETVIVPIELYNAYDYIPDATVTYTLSSQGRTLAVSTGRLTGIEIGKNHSLGYLSYPTASFESPAKYTLTVEVDYLGRKAHNHWDFWVYPSETTLRPTDGILVTDTLDNAAIERLRAGGRVLLTAAGKVKYGDDVKQTYLPVFWNTSWFKMRPPHTTGAVIDTDHPLFSRFPSDDWGNLNWWELLNKAQVMNLGRFPLDYQSPVQPIDTWHVSRKLGMIVEANVLGGRLLMTTFDIDTDLDRRHVARAMRNALIDYMLSDDFNPPMTVDVALVRSLYDEHAPAVDMMTKDSPDELKPKLK